MNVGDFLKNFVINTWYKAVMYLAGGILAVSFFWEVKGLTNHQLQLLSVGAFLVGLGEWKSHKLKSVIKAPSAYTGGVALLGTGEVREFDLIGIGLDIIGILFFVRGIWRIWHGWA